MKKKVNINGKPTYVEFDMLEKGHINVEKLKDRTVYTTLCLFFIGDKQYTGVKVSQKGKVFYTYYKYNFIKFYNLKKMIEYILNK